MWIKERTMNYKHPIAKCPKCRRSIIYSDNPKDKVIFFVREPDENYRVSIYCAQSAKQCWPLRK